MLICYVADLPFEVPGARNMSEHNGSQNSERSSEQERPQGWEALKQHVLDHKVEVALWVTRVFTILFTCGYFIPLLG